MLLLESGNSLSIIECRNKLEQEIRKGTFEIEKSQERYELQQEVKRNSEALKFTNSRLLQMEKMQEATFRFIVKINEALISLAMLRAILGGWLMAEKARGVCQMTLQILVDCPCRHCPWKLRSKCDRYARV